MMIPVISLAQRMRRYSYLLVPSRMPRTYWGFIENKARHIVAMVIGDGWGSGRINVIRERSRIRARRVPRFAGGRSLIE